MANLRNCPLCGGIAEMELLVGYVEANIPDEYFIVCSNCGCGVSGTNEQEVMELWNSRSEHCGHWHENNECTYNECSECGQTVMTDDIECYKFCHGCGARMGE